jgi:hypothetical protein
MKIGVIGAGPIGATLAEQFLRVGHTVTIANSRGPETLAELVESLGAGAQASTAEGAAEFGEVVAIPIVYGRYRELPVAALAGKIVIDTTNYWAVRDGDMPELTTSGKTQSELIQEVLPTSLLVKAFNMIYWERLRLWGRPAGNPDRIAIPVSGDDAKAKRVVQGLIDEIGFDTVDAGSLVKGGKSHEMGTEIFPGTGPAPTFSRLALKETLGLDKSA